jgi:hypothetical protein
MSSLRDRLLPILHPLALFASIFILGCISPIRSTKLWFPFRLALTLLGVACVAWVSVTTYSESGLLRAVAVFALANAALFTVWFCFVFILGIMMIFYINRQQ